MEDDKIIKNMKKALKGAKKRSRGKSKSSQGSSTASRSKSNDDSLGEELGNQLMRNWVFSSPPSANPIHSQAAAAVVDSSSNSEELSQQTVKKVNAFERLMSKRHEPLTPISPETANVKKKQPQKKSRKLKPSNLDDEENTSMDQSSNSIRKFFHGSSEAVDEESLALPSNKKRNRICSEEPEPPPAVELTPKAAKRRKTKLETFELESNENSFVVDSPSSTYQSGRPRRSCAGNVTYDDFDEVLKSPEKNKKTDDGGRRKKQQRKNEDDAFLIDDDDDESPIKPKKLAPVFVKRMPKPVIDPAVQEARRNFLFSDLPEDMRQSMDKQREYEHEILGNEMVAYPTVAHVMGAPRVMQCGDVDWTSSRVKLNFKDDEDDAHPTQHRPLCRGRLTDSHLVHDHLQRPKKIPSKSSSEFRVEWSEVALKSLKKTVEQCKKNFGDFPTNRCFKQLFPKFQQQHSRADENLQLFVDLVKPSVLADFVIGKKPTEQLHNFLQSWNEKADEYESTDDEYSSGGSNSRQSSKGANNFNVLTGPPGCGKTLAVYAMAAELNFRVIEVNAGARRSGKIMLQELQEATQSHRVKKSIEPTDEQSSNDSQKSVILIEDAELVFESDDGFVSAIQQLINISKRPVILTTSNSACQHLQKFINHREIAFDLSSMEDDSSRVGKYLSLLCLAANYRIDCAAVEHLFMTNGRDMRKTINEIEFFIRSRSSTDDDDDDLLDFYLPNRQQEAGRRPSPPANSPHADEETSSAHFELTMMSSWMMLSDDGNEDDDLMADMKCFVERCRRNVMNSKDAMHKIIVQNNSSRASSTCTASTIAHHLISTTQSTTNRVLSGDIAPILRDMCRSEKARLDAGRRTSSTNRGHYLRHLIALSSFGNDYFNEQTEMFQS